MLTLGNTNYILLEICFNGPTIKKARHYRQVQGEMTITGLTLWFVNRNHNLFVERINVDIQFVACMLPKLQEFFFNYLHQWPYNKNWRDVQKTNVFNNVYMSSLWAPWQNGPYKNIQNITKHGLYKDATDIKK